MGIPVGLDIGNDKCVIAIAKNGIVDALPNEESTRETPTVVHFAEKHRLFGTSGASAATRNPKSTISQLKRLIGRRFDEKDFQEERRRLPYETSRDTEGGISVKVRYLNEEYSFTAVEMLAMLMSYLKRTAEQATGSAVSDCVIAVPAYFTKKQQNAYRDAARIAGWKPLGLLREGTATALGYRNDRDGAAKAVVAFVDIGHCDTQVTVVRFEGQKMKVLAKACDPNLGGRDFDEVIFHYFVDMFKDRYKIDARSNVKASVRLRMACEKAKRVLSANREAPISIDCLMDGIDAKGMITRERFDELSSGLLGRIGAKCREALRNGDVDRVHSVELVGSGSRIPAISSTLARVLGKGVSRTLNGSECIACGCALKCERMLKQVSQANDCEQDKMIYDGAGRNDLSKARDTEEKLACQDRITERAKERRNALEAYIYKLRNEHLRNKRVANEAAKDIISSKLTEIEEWLYEEGDDKLEEVYQDKFQKLTLFINHVENRDKEETQIQTSREIQTDIMEPPVLGRSLKSSRGDAVSYKFSDAKLRRSDWTFRRKTNIIQDRFGSASSAVMARISSACNPCGLTDAKSPSPRKHSQYTGTIYRILPKRFRRSHTIIKC